jgi:hypothetical protein
VKTLGVQSVVAGATGLGVGVSSFKSMGIGAFCSPLQPRQTKDAELQKLEVREL